MKRQTLAERFWPRVEKTDGCWLWKGGKFPNGYGQIWHNGKTRGIHRVAWELQVGPIPDGLFVLHHCDVKNCVRVHSEHLFLGTPKDNSKDMAAKGRAGPQKFPWLWAGEKSANHKLTSEQVAQIRAIVKVRRQPSDEKIGKLFGVHRVMINRIRLRKSWAYE